MVSTKEMVLAGKIGREDANLENMGIATLIGSMAENTGMHGLPNISRSKSLFRKLFWLIIFLAGVAMMTWQVYEAFKKFQSHPTETSIEPKSNTTLPFPAVTFCNLNPIKKSKLSDLGDIESLLNSNSNSSSEWTPSGTAQPSSFFDWDAQGDAAYANEDAEFTLREKILEGLYSLTVAEKQAAGHQLNDILLSCTYQGYACGPKNFSTFYNSLFGNCYTFNGGEMNTAAKAGKVGPFYSLSLELYIEQTEYIPGLADAAGMRVVVHNPNAMPFPEDEGFSVAPGELSYVGLHRVEFTRSSPPHGECQRFSENETLARNAWKQKYNFLEYTRRSCAKTCYQQYVMSICGCSDRDFPNEGTPFENITKGQNFSACNSEDEAMEECQQQVYTNFTENILNCSKTCPPPCSEATHEITQSHARWPTEAKANDLVNQVLQKSSEIFDALINMDAEERTETVRENVLKILVYFKSLEYTTITTKPSFGIVDLLASIGGQVGLWLGLSVITLFEIVELFFDAWAFAFCKCLETVPKKKSKNLIQVTPRSEENEIGTSPSHVHIDHVNGPNQKIVW